jgi:2-dehydropantoate 2-reductase
MGQVPHYLIIGDGRVARHIHHYFSLLQIPFSSWHRQQPFSSLHQALVHATHVLILIKDNAIEHFIVQHKPYSQAMWIHFSGSLVTEHAYGAHPLMTFSGSLYDLAQYQAIPFVLDHDAIAFAELLPGLPNQHVRLHTSLKPKYHALCVLSGNFSCLLWQKLFNTLENEFNIPQSIAYQYLYQQTQNLFTHPQTAMTGPLVRGDNLTIDNNLTALENDPFQHVYKSFVECYEKIGSVDNSTMLSVTH